MGNREKKTHKKNYINKIHLKKKRETKEYVTEIQWPHIRGRRLSPWVLTPHLHIDAICFNYGDDCGVIDPRFAFGRRSARRKKNKKKQKNQPEEKQQQKMETLSAAVEEEEEEEEEEVEKC